MKVVLREDIEKLGLRGEVVDVARGYARNYLLPRKLAEHATPARVAELEKVNSRRALSEAQSFEQAQEIGQRLGQAELRFDVKAGETGSLFGSVTPTDIAEELWTKHKVRVDRRKIGVDTIKRIGRYQVPIELFPEVTVETRVLVVPEGGELPPEEELEAIEEAEAAEAAAAEAAAEEARAEAEAAIEQELAPEEEPEAEAEVPTREAAEEPGETEGATEQELAQEEAPEAEAEVPAPEAAEGPAEPEESQERT